MKRQTIRTPIKVAVVVSYLVMIAMNVAANALPINGRSTAAVSDAYPNLFAPAGITFSIWGVIYLLLACYVLYQVGLFSARDAPPPTTAQLATWERVGILFSVSSLVNALWILCWHYEQILLSTVLLIMMLGLVGSIARMINLARPAGRDRWLIRLPFSVYFGWLTVATIANITVWLVSVRWDRFGLPQATWAAVIIAVGALIGGGVVLRNRDLAYGVVLIWAYLGIVIKHTSPDGFAGAYPIVIAVTVVSMVALAAACVWVVWRPRAITARDS